MRAGTIMNGALIKFIFKDTAVFSASRIGPTEDLCRRAPARIDTDETVPKRGQSNGDHLAFHLCSFFEDGVDGSDDLIKRFVGIELRAAVFCNREIVLDLYRCFWADVRVAVIKSGADTG